MNSSYPTYEEWKQFLGAITESGRVLCSYPTYEEWKPVEYPVPLEF